MGAAVQLGELRWSDPHHRPAVGIEAEGRHDWHAGGLGAKDRSLELLDRRKRFGPQHVDATAHERLGLLGEGFGRFLDRQRPERLEYLAGRAHAAGDDDVRADALGGGARDPRGSFIQFRDAAIRLVQLQSMPRPAEGIGQQDVRSRDGEGAMHVDDALGVLDVPQFRRVAGLKTTLEQAAAHAAVG